MNEQYENCLIMFPLTSKLCIQKEISIVENKLKSIIKMPERCLFCKLI